MTESDNTPLVAYEAREGTAVLTLDSPHNRNALSDRLVADLLEGLRRAEADKTIRAVVLTHTGNTFCAGADLSAASANQAGDLARVRGEQLVAVLRSIVVLDKPVIGRIDGHVRAGGMGLVGACDIVVAGPRSTFALTESRLGLAAAAISLVVLPRLTSRSAAYLFLTGDRIGPDEAARIGLVTESVETTEDAVQVLTAALAQASPQGLRESKALLNHAVLAEFNASAERLIDQSARLFTSDESQEGMAAFLEKRPPRWVQ